MPSEPSSGDSRELVPHSDPPTTALDVAAVITSAIPWLGGPVSAVLSGISLSRKLERAKEVLDGLAADLRDFESEAAKSYVRTDEFQELLEKTLHQAADERNAEKRRMYRAFLVDAIQAPGQPYDEQVRFLRTLEELQPDHLRVIKALSLPPTDSEGLVGSPSQTLLKRLPDMSADRLKDLIDQLNDMRVTAFKSLNTMMTYSGAQDLRHMITSYGNRFLGFILQAE